MHFADKLKEIIFNKKIGKEFWAIKGISFEVKKGESVGIIGLNGAGKSTLLQMIVGTLNPTHGSCHVDGRIAALLELGAGFNPEYTGIENVFLNASIFGLSRLETQEKLQKIIDFADIGDHVYQPVKTYSSGMFVRLAFAVSAHLQPDILIVDEALSVGDVLFQQKCFAHLSGTLKNKTKLFVTHDFATLSLVANRCIVLSEGLIIFDGPTKQAIKYYNEIIHSKSQVQNIESGDTLLPDNLSSLNNAINDFKDVDSNALSGLRDYEISKYSLVVNDSKTSIVNHGDVITISLLVKSNIAKRLTGKPVVGFFFRDKFGQKIFGQNSLSLREEFSVENFTKIEFEFNWPNLQTGEYTLTLGLGFVDQSNEVVHDVQCWVNDFEILHCVTPHIEHGIFSVPFNDFKVNDYVIK